MSSITQMQLPSMPGTVVKLLSTFADPDFGIADVVNVLQTDPALCGKLLKAVNSPIYGASRKVTDLKRASMLLGKKNVSILALSFSLTDKASRSDQTQIRMQKFWNQSLISGIAASVLARQYKVLNIDEAFLLGILARIGRLAAIINSPEQYESNLEICDQHGYSVDSLYLPKLGRTSEELTLEFLKSWMLPDTFVATMENMQRAASQDRNQAVQKDQHPRSSSVINASSILRGGLAISDFLLGENCGIALATIHELLGPLLERSDDTFELILSSVKSEFAAYAELLDSKAGHFDSPAELRDQAMRQLSEIALQQDLDSTPPSTHSISSEVSWLKKRIDDLSERLTLDAMTGISNRDHFDKQLEKLQSIADADAIVGLLFVDVDKFKVVNDSYGHQTGDEVICHVATTLKNSFRAEDTVARYGGDEFVVLCQLSSREELMQVAERLRSNLENHAFLYETTVVHVSASIGGAVGVYNGDQTFNKALMNEADLAMYDSKRAGGNRVSIRDVDMASSELVLESTQL